VDPGEFIIKLPSPITIGDEKGKGYIGDRSCTKYIP
jgi:hypothetical protein